MKITRILAVVVLPSSYAFPPQTPLQKVTTNNYNNINKIKLYSTDVRSSQEKEENKKDQQQGAHLDTVLKHEAEPIIATWPRFDELDSKLIKLSLPAIANFAINPLIGAVDLFWVGRMGNALALAGMGAANQVFNSAFWIFSFLPTVTAPLVARAYASGDEEKLQDLICQAILLGSIFSIMGCALMLKYPTKVLSIVLKSDSAAYSFATSYLKIRAISFFPAMIVTVGYAAFRGMLDNSTPLKISLGTNILNAVMDPLLIFRTSLGVAGAAAATVCSEIIAFVTYMRLMLKRRMVRWSKLLNLPKWDSLKPLVLGGLAVQLRNIALNVTFLSVTRATQGIDNTGVAAAAHSIAIQVFQVGGVFLLALASVAAAVVPAEIQSRGKESASGMVRRLMAWGVILGSVLGAVQVGIIPFLNKITPLPQVQEAAKIPSYIASILQIINGAVFIGEGIMAGCQNFLTLSFSTVIATAGMVQALKILSTKYGLPGVWMSFGVFNGLRLAGVIVHQFVTGPLSKRQMRKEASSSVVG